MGNGNRPTLEFRREVVWLALTSGRTRGEIAEDLVIGSRTEPKHRVRLQPTHNIRIRLTLPKYYLFVLYTI